MNNPNNPFTCQPRQSPAAGSRDITDILSSYLPWDGEYSTSWEGRNMYGMRIHNERLESGKVYEAYDGKRLIFEVGCFTTIYLQINPFAATHHKFFIQASDGFFFDITGRVIATQVFEKTAAVITVAKYEMYFMMGLFSTVSVPMWLAVTGTDITVTFATHKAKLVAFKELSHTITTEMEKIQHLAPTLHKKLTEFISNEKINNAKQAAKNLPQKIITDEKAQAQVAGILYGKYALSASSLTVWTALSTVLTQAIVKAATNSTGAYAEAIDQRYSGVIRDFRNVNWENPTEVRLVSQKLVALFIESKVPFTVNEAETIFREVKAHPKELEKSVTTLFDAFTKFKTKINK